MFNDEKLKKTHVVRVRFNDYDYAKLLSGAELDGDQLAVFVRRLVANSLHDKTLLDSIIQSNRSQP